LPAVAGGRRQGGGWKVRLRHCRAVVERFWVGNFWGVSPRNFLFAWHANISEGLKEALAPNRREANAKATALLATVGWGGSLSKYGVRSASEPELARQVGNLAKSGNAQKSDNLPR